MRLPPPPGSLPSPPGSLPASPRGSRRGPAGAHAPTQRHVETPESASRWRAPHRRRGSWHWDRPHQHREEQNVGSGVVTQREGLGLLGQQTWRVEVGETKEVTVPTRVGKGLARPLLSLARERGAFAHGISVLVLGPQVEQGAAVSRVSSQPSGLCWGGCCGFQLLPGPTSGGSGCQWPGMTLGKSGPGLEGGNTAERVVSADPRRTVGKRQKHSVSWEGHSRGQPPGGEASSFATVSLSFPHLSW